MKNQYVGDIGDFGKYSLLREFALAGIKIGINWYLTEADDSNDGKMTEYLNQNTMRRYCPVVFDALKEITSKKDKDVSDIEKCGIIPNAIFYSSQLKMTGTSIERKQIRNEWFQNSLKVLASAELIFMDPDNGLLENKDSSKKNAEKYVLPEEVEAYYQEGHDVVYYCHKGRRTYDQWMSYKSLMVEKIPSAKPVVLTYHKGSQRSYIFMIHERNYILYRKVIDCFQNHWYRIFGEEYTSKGNIAGQKIGEAFELEKSDGTHITIEHRTDGKIQILSSKEPNTIRIETPDGFCHMLDI